MRTFDLRHCGRQVAIAFAVAAQATLVLFGTAHARAEFTSPEAALRQGISAYNGGYPELAIPALEHAAAQNLFLGSYYLARLYSDANTPHTDHGKAYILFQKIANEHADVDPDHDARAPFVASALVALAKYVKGGLPEIGVRPNASLAGEYLHHAAVFFNDEDAQFELSKMQLNGDGVRLDIARGRHWMAVLAKKGHAGAQAFLADLYWRGKFMSKDPVRALTLISVAVKNARSGDRIWIEDIYQSIFCGASEGVRKQATGMVAEWDNRYGRKPVLPGRSNLGAMDMPATRTCADGKPVPLDTGKLPLGPGSAPIEAAKPAHDLPRIAVEPSRDDADRSLGFMRGGAMAPTGGSYRAVGERR